MPNDMHKQVLDANEAFHDQFAELYEDYYSDVIFFEKNQERIQKHLATIRDSSGGETLLDVGCGTGNIGRLARDLFPVRLGVDISARSLERASRYYTQVHQGDVCNLTQIDDESVDVVTGYSLLHHLAHPAELFRECARVLRPGGCVYFDNDPNSMYFVFKLTSYLPGWIKDELEKMNAGKTAADEVIQQQRSTYQTAEFHHHHGRFEGFFPKVVKRSLERNGYHDVSVQLYRINRAERTVQVADYSFFSQFRYSQMAVTACYGTKTNVQRVSSRAA